MEKKKKKIPKKKPVIKETNKKSLRNACLLIAVIFLALLIRIGWIQFVQGASLKESAYNQQTINRIINTKRGTIYDATGKKLAISMSVDTVTINPSKLTLGQKSEEDKNAKKEKIAKKLSEIFELNYEEVLGKVNSTASVETVAKRVEQSKIDTLKKWMEEEKIAVGINIDEDSKRSYPYENLASTLIGFCGDDNNGLQGVEAKWDDVLTGTPGKIVTSKDAIQEEIPDQKQTYIPAENGSDLVLTLDVNIQSIVEKYLKEAVEQNYCTRGGTVVAMKPSTGDILAMATYPDYNLNTPFEPNTEELKKNWDTIDATTKTKTLNEMWRNRVISDTYEPGSTFKLITASVALEENITIPDKPNDFICMGYEEVSGVKIGCWSQNHKGNLSLRNSLEKSCNPSLMQLGKRIGALTLDKYYRAYGIKDKTGVAIAGETTGLFHDPDKMGPVELATESFGQRITVTPMQLVTAISAIANDGILMQPRIVKQTVNTDTGATSNIDPVQVRQVISKTTSESMRDMMKSVVTDGSGRNAQVAGYSIGGKTGTSEPPVGKESEGYVASYVAITPTENPELCLLVTLYDPKGISHQGGQICGPVVAKMLAEILPYMGLASSDTQASNVTLSQTENQTITVPDIRNKTATEAEKILTTAGFRISSSIENKNETIVTDQVPKPGTTLYKDSLIALYSQGNNVKVSVAVPDLKGMTFDEAKSALKAKNLNLVAEGSGTVASQDPSANSTVEGEGSVVKVTLKQ